MKQTDFDFIRDKFSSDGVHAPDELNEELVQRQLAGVQPLQEKKSHKVLIGTVSVAASVAVITAGAFVAANIFGALPWQKKPIPEPLTGTASLRAFQNKDEIRDTIRRTMDFKKNLYSYDQSSAADEVHNRIEVDDSTYERSICVVGPGAVEVLIGRVDCTYIDIIDVEVVSLECALEHEIVNLVVYLTAVEMVTGMDVQRLDGDSNGNSEFIKL